MARQPSKEDSLSDDFDFDEESEEERDGENDEEDEEGEASRHNSSAPEKDLYTDRFPFSVAVAIICFLNLLLLAVEVDMTCPKCDSNPAWGIIQHIFTAAFLIEIIVRLVVAGPKRYFLGSVISQFPISVLSCTDFTIVMLRVLDCWILQPAGVQSKLHLVSGFRVLHLGSCVRHLQLNKAFRELWLVISAVSETLKTLGWVGFLIIMVIWIMAVLISMSLIGLEASDFNMDRARWSFDEYWGHVMSVAYSLFQFSTHDMWRDSLVYPLMYRDYGIIFLFVGFYTLGVMALSNAILGVVVECTLSTSKRNNEMLQKELDALDDAVMMSLRGIFHEADTDGSGCLDRQELRESLSKHRVRDRIKFLQLPIKDLEMLFELLDEDMTGEIDTDFFFRGVSRLRGQAMASDLHQMSIDLKKGMAAVDESQEKLGKINDHLAEVLDCLDEVDNEIIQGSSAAEKDPVVQFRRVNARKRQSKSDMMRGKWVAGIRVQDIPPDPWLEFVSEEELHGKKQVAVSAGQRAGREQIAEALLAHNQLRQERHEKEQVEKDLREHEEKRRREMIEMQEAAIAPYREYEKKKKKKKEQEDDILELADSQPPPPPLPQHLAMVKAQQEKLKADAKQKKALALKNKRASRKF
eukprot:TRINITY_DN62220_c0_g1_i1.p1 TRINITY_DN62220_c0_g1~~TRINITY_DN62220_c0_g1_i1.p1  ORF type:complete len:637 (+),score=156.67 TRINITY_DN62220_c0_g1_i1:86-1996(+)